MVTVLIILLVLFALGVFPAWPYSRGWGYAPAGFFAVLLVILLLWLLLGGPR